MVRIDASGSSHLHIDRKVVCILRRADRLCPPYSEEADTLQDFIDFILIILVIRILHGETHHVRRRICEDEIIDTDERFPVMLAADGKLERVIAAGLHHLLVHDLHVLGALSHLVRYFLDLLHLFLAGGCRKFLPFFPASGPSDPYCNP